MSVRWNCDVDTFDRAKFGVGCCRKRYACFLEKLTKNLKLVFISHVSS